MTGVAHIVSIVEGEGEQQAVPVLLRNVGLAMDPPRQVDGWTTVRVSRDTFPRVDYVRRRALLDARDSAGDSGAVFVLLDSDGEPPCRHSRRGGAPCLLGGDLLSEVQSIVTDVPVAVVMADRMFESWFLAAAEPLAEHPMFLPGLRFAGDPELEPDPKDRLADYMLPGRKYKPIPDQARLTHHMNLQMARQRSPSFDWCYKEIERLILAVCHR